MLCMSKEIKIKSNGLRNELKEIRKSIDKLTNAIQMAQTHKQYEKYTINRSDHAPDGMRWVTTVSKDETDQSRKDDVLHDFD